MDGVAQPLAPGARLREQVLQVNRAARWVTRAALSGRTRQPCSQHAASSRSPMRAPARQARDRRGADRARQVVQLQPDHLTTVKGNVMGMESPCAARLTRMRRGERNTCSAGVSVSLIGVPVRPRHCPMTGVMWSCGARLGANCPLQGLVADDDRVAGICAPWSCTTINRIQQRVDSLALALVALQAHDDARRRQDHRWIDGECYTLSDSATTTMLETLHLPAIGGQHRPATPSDDRAR